MRDINRIPEFCDEFAKCWMKAAPDQRFGQFISNFFGWIFTTKKVDIWFPEEQKMLQYLREYCHMEEEDAGSN